MAMMQSWQGEVCLGIPEPKNGSQSLWSLLEVAKFEGICGESMEKNTEICWENLDLCCFRKLLSTFGC